jgi:hypothetical protein
LSTTSIFNDAGNIVARDGVAVARSCETSSNVEIVRLCDRSVRSRPREAAHRVALRVNDDDVDVDPVRWRI